MYCTRMNKLSCADLRQDMLTLQIISIMDSQWKADGLNLRSVCAREWPSHVCYYVGLYIMDIHVHCTSASVG